MTQDSSARGVPPSQTPTFSQFASFTTPVASQSTTPQPAAHQQPQPPAPQPASDPFAALGASYTSPPPKPTVSNEDDEWNFSSSLPPEAPTPEVPTKPREHKSTVSDTNLRTEFLAKRVGSNNSIDIVFSFTNNTAQPISELHFQLAVTKVRP